MTVVVRTMRPEEFKSALRLLQLAEQEQKRLIGLDCAERPDVALVRAQGIFIADDQEPMVGIALASAGQDGCGTIEWLYVRAPFRRRGVALELIRAADKFLTWECRCIRVRVLVYETNEAAQRLYEKLGFRRFSSMWEAPVVTAGATAGLPTRP